MRQRYKNANDICKYLYKKIFMHSMVGIDVILAHKGLQEILMHVQKVRNRKKKVKKKDMSISLNL